MAKRLGSGIVTGLVLAVLTAGTATGEGRFEPPVDAPVVREFEAPAHRFGPGHRGIDYGTPAGTEVRAAGAGTVSFAGSVAGGLFITIQHGGGLNTTYSFLGAAEVAEGDRVTKGWQIGLSGEGHPDGPPALHFGARRDGEYIDPATLFLDFDDLTDHLMLVS